MITLDMASVVAGFLEVHDIRKLMRTCKKIRYDKQVRNALVAQYKARLHPATDASDYIKNMIGIQSTRVYRIYSEQGDRSVNIYLGPPEFALLKVACFSIHFKDFLYTFNGPSLDGVVGLFFRELDVQQDGMRVVLVVNGTLVLRAQSSNCYAVPRI